MRGHIPVLSLLAAFALVLSACGGTSGEADGGAGEASTSPPSGTAPDGELYAPLMRSCLEQFGYDVEVLPDGGIGVQYASEDATLEQSAKLQSEYEERFAGCLTETGFDQPSGVSPEEDYRHLIAVDDCFREQGYDILSPTFEEFSEGRFPDNSDRLPATQAEQQALFGLCEG